MKKILTIGLLITLAVVCTYFYFQWKQVPSGSLQLLSRNIIVGVKIDPPYQLLAKLTQEEQKRQEVAIVASVDRILSDLDENKYSYSGLKRFTITPGFALVVSDGGYRYLLKHPLVSGVEEDQQSQPSRAAVF